LSIRIAEVTHGMEPDQQVVEKVFFLRLVKNIQMHAYPFTAITFSSFFNQLSVTNNRSEDVWTA
jgi:hypothetical protein